MTSHKWATGLPTPRWDTGNRADLTRVLTDDGSLIRLSPQTQGDLRINRLYRFVLYRCRRAPQTEAEVPAILLIGAEPGECL